MSNLSQISICWCWLSKEFIIVSDISFLFVRVVIVEFSNFQYSNWIIMELATFYTKELKNEFNTLFFLPRPLINLFSTQCRIEIADDNKVVIRVVFCCFTYFWLLELFSVMLRETTKSFCLTKLYYYDNWGFNLNDYWMRSLLSFIRLQDHLRSSSLFAARRCSILHNIVFFCAFCPHHRIRFNRNKHTKSTLVVIIQKIFFFGWISSFFFDEFP